MNFNNTHRRIQTVGDIKNIFQIRMLLKYLYIYAYLK